MADTKITGLTALTGIASGDWVEVVDVSDTSMAASGTNKKITRANLLNIGSDVQAWDADLDALAALSSTAGMVSRTGAGAFSVRTIAGTSNQIAVTNGDGASAAPTIAFVTSPVMPSGSTGTTQSAGDNSTKLATTAYSDTLAWADYTPTITNFTTGNGSKYGRYIQKGKWVTFVAGFIFGSTSSIGGAITITFPTGVTGASLPGSATLGSMGSTAFYDSSALTVYEGALTWASTTTCQPKAVQYDPTITTAGQYVKRVNLSSTVPMTWATSDELQIMGTYEAA